MTYRNYIEKAETYAREAEREADADTARMLRDVARNWMTLADNHERMAQRAAMLGYAIR